MPSPARPARVATVAARAPDPDRRACPFPNCTDDIPFFRFCCTSHWSRLSDGLRTEASNQWKDYLDRLLGVSQLADARDALVDKACDLDADGHGSTASQPVRGGACPDCRADVILAPLNGPAMIRHAFDPVHSDSGVYVCVGGVARLRPGGVPGKPALAKLTIHAETCRGRQNTGRGTGAVRAA